MLQITLPSKRAHIIILISIFMSCIFFSLIKKEYTMLGKEYGEEQSTHKRGRVVTLYIIGSVLLYFLIMLF